MNYRARVNDRNYPVGVENIGPKRFKVTSDQTVAEIELVNKNDILTWTLRSGGRVMKAQTRTLPNDVVEVWLSGVPFSASIQTTGAAEYSLRSPTAGQAAYGGAIRALMPGRITSVLVKETDRVEIGSPLLILEAMKMQNEIASPVKGEVKSIRVKEGEIVSKDALLMLIG